METEIVIKPIGERWLWAVRTYDDHGEAVDLDGGVAATRDEAVEAACKARDSREGG